MCGLGDSSLLCASQGALHFPSQYPDTKAGQRHQSEVAAEQGSKHKKRPASKRTNYLKYGVAAAFDPPWRELVSNWCNIEIKANTAQRTGQETSETDQTYENKQDFYVLRYGRVLRALSNLCHSGKRNSMNDVESKIAASVLSDECYRNALVPVYIEMVTKGIPGNLSMICIPTEQDFRNIQGTIDWKAPEEPKHKVPKVFTKAKTKAKTKELKAKREQIMEEVTKNAVKNIRGSCSREIGRLCV